MVKAKDKRDKEQVAGLQHGAMASQMPASSGVTIVRHNVQARMVSCWLFAIFLLLLVPNLSSAVLPTVETLPPVTSHLKLPSGVAVGDDETIYVAESSLNQVRIFNKSGIYQRSVYGLSGPTSIAVDASGRIYIGNKGKGNVEIYASNLSLIGKLGQGDGEFLRPVGVAVDSAGLIYVVDGREHKVKIYNADHTFKSSFGSMGTGNGQFQTPTSIVINEVTSEILIPDLVALSTSARVQVFDLDGGFLRSFITTGTNEVGETVAFIRPYGIAVDTLDRIYVTDGYQNVVTVYGTSGNYLGKFYDTNRPLRNPLGIAFAPGTSRLFVASLNAAAVETYGIDNVYGDIAITPQAHDFGTVMIDDAPTSQSFTLSNDGSGYLSTGAVTLTGADASGFSIISSDCADRILAPAANCAIEIKFQPLAAGSKSASLSIISDDLYLPVLNATLSGNVDVLQHRLTVSRAGVGSGVVQASGINCGTVCSAEYAEGAAVTLSAQTIGESAFIGWSGGGCSGTAACTVTMTQATTVTATFDLVVSTFSGSYSITASAGDNGSISPADTTTHNAGTTVNFTITADTGYEVSDVWVDGDSVGAVSSYSFEDLSKDHTITAEFVAINTLLLSSIETGEVSVDDQWKRVEFNKSFTDPVVVAKPASRNDPLPAVVRVRNVDTQGFEVRIQEWEYLYALLDDSTDHAEEQVGYVVMERGSYMLEDGTRVEAGLFDTDTTSSFEAISFTQPFTVPPVVVSSVVTYSEEEKAVIGRMGNINATGFGYMLQEQGANDQTHVIERVSFIAWEPSQGSQNGISFEVGTVGSVLTQQSKAVVFNPSYQSQPLFIADLQTTNGGTVNLRWSNKSTTEVTILLDQEESSAWFTSIFSQSAFVPPVPSTEGVGYLILWSAEMLPQTLTVEKTGQGSGRVQSQAQGIDCGAACSSSYNRGTEVTLTAVAEGDSLFAGWSGGCSGTASCVVTLDQAITVTATFDINPPPPPATYTITATAGANGSITPQGETVVNAGANQTYTIVANAGYHIVNVIVDGKAKGVKSSYPFAGIDANHTITASFASSIFKLTDITMGEVNAGHIWKHVVLDRFYADPIVVAKPASRDEDDPAVVRIRNVSTRGFDIKIQEWGYLDGIHAEERVNYIVMESGTHRLNDRTLIEAGRFETSNTDAFGSVLFTQPKHVPPVVISSVVSYNEEDAVTGRIKKVNEKGFQYMLQEQAGNTTGHATETVSYIAWEPSLGRQDEVNFEVGCIGKVETQQFTKIDFLGGYADLPLFVADLQTAVGSDAVNLRWQDKNEGNIDVLIDQERSQAGESASPSVENIGYLILSDQVTPPCKFGGDDCDGDGLTNDDEITIYGTDPHLANTDGDGLDDGREVNYWMGNWGSDNDDDGLINLLDYDSNGDGGGEYDGSSYGQDRKMGCGSATVVSRAKEEGGTNSSFNSERDAFEKRGGFEKRRGFSAPDRTFKQRPGFRSPVRSFDRRIGFD